MSAEWIAKRRELLDAATEGPWEWRAYTGNAMQLVKRNHGFHDHNVLKTTDDWPPYTQDAEFIADARTSLPRALDALEAVLALHHAVGIYDECECPDDAKTEGHLDVYEVGTTCNKLYDICDECCRNDGYQTEDCADCHRHGLPGETHICATIRAIETALGADS